MRCNIWLFFNLNNFSYNFYKNDGCMNYYTNTLYVSKRNLYSQNVASGKGTMFVCYRFFVSLHCIIHWLWKWRKSKISQQKIPNFEKLNIWLKIWTAQWLVLLFHRKMVLGLNPWARYPGGSNSAIDGNVNSTLSLWDGLVTEWWPIQGVPYPSLCDSWGRLQSLPWPWTG